MLVLGVDPSTSKSGWALVRDGELEMIGLIKPPTKLKLQEQKIDFLGTSLRGIVTFARPDLVVIEEVGRPPKGNVKVMRALVRAEAVCGYEARQAGCETLLCAVTAVREILTGSGKTGKETMFNMMVEKYPQVEWREMEKGGDDMSDALAMGLAGPELRKRL